LIEEARDLIAQGEDSLKVEIRSVNNGLNVHGRSWFDE
jgi:hypothetical protein